MTVKQKGPSSLREGSVAGEPLTEDSRQCSIISTMKEVLNLPLLL
jgi:hypothetical protein